MSAEEEEEEVDKGEGEKDPMIFLNFRQLTQLYLDEKDKRVLKAIRELARERKEEVEKEERCKPNE